MTLVSKNQFDRFVMVVDHLEQIYKIKKEIEQEGLRDTKGEWTKKSYSDNPGICALGSIQLMGAPADQELLDLFAEHVRRPIQEIWDKHENNTILSRVVDLDSGVRVFTYANSWKEIEPFWLAKEARDQEVSA